MVEGLIGKKIGMTQTFDDEGNVVPATVIQAGPCAVIQKKRKDKDGYAAVQLGFIEDKPKRRPSKPLAGHFQKSGLAPTRLLREFRINEIREVKEGDQFSVEIFKVGEQVDVTGTSKGKGFAGVVKRWGFKGGKASHGSMFHRAPGSIGASAFPSRVIKGKKLPGHMGQERVTVKNLTVVDTDKDTNLLVVKGAVPGANGGYVLIKKVFFEFELIPSEKEPKGETHRVKKPRDEEPKKVKDEEVESEGTGPGKEEPVEEVAQEEGPAEDRAPEPKNEGQD